MRAILNYGHTVAHAIEAATGYGTVTHGEAVAAGMRVAGRLSTEIVGLSAADREWQDRLLDRLGLRPLPPVQPAAVLRRLGHDKKAVGGEVRWVLLARRGEPVTLLLRSGHMLKVGRDFDEPTFARVVALLEGG